MKTNAARIPVSEAAKLMGVSPQFVRVAMQQGILPIGMATRLTGGKFTYYISPKLFEEYTGIKWKEGESENHKKITA